MSTDLPARLGTGNAVMAFIPTDLDQIWRMARMAVVGKMAPKSLVEGKDPDEATSAAAIAIMAGAELGLTPLMALRSYAVVNGRPALWGDGLKAVVRQSGRCEFIRTGSDQTKGWCEAKRKDTGEEKRVEFTLEQAAAAGLTKKTGPWTSGYADIMMERRATNRCLNDLFADVLGGIVSADEAMEDGPIARPSRTEDAPEIPEVETKTIDATATSATSGEVEKINTPTNADLAGDFNDDSSGFESGATNKPQMVASGDTFKVRLDEELAVAGDKPTLEEIWDSLDVENSLGGDDFAIAGAEEIKAKHVARIEKKELELAGQLNLLDGPTI